MYFGTTFYRLKRIKSTPTAKVKEPRGVKLPVLTDRQLAIMEGKASNIRKNELSVLLDKLNRLDMQNELQELLNRYAHFFESEPSAPPKYTPVEAHALLQAMTPWKLPYKETDDDMKQDGFKDRLRIAMETAGLKQHDLVSMTKISAGNISRYLQGTMNPRPDKIKVMADALGIDAAWLAGESGGNGGKMELAALFDKLDKQDRKLVMGLATALLKDVKYAEAAAE